MWILSTGTYASPLLGLGIGWRPALALAIERRPQIGFIEVVAENLDADRPIPSPIAALQRRGVTVIPHGISLSLGGAEELDLGRVAALDKLARRVSAPFVSEHIAFVRAGGMEAGHLLPVSRTRAALEVLVENIGQATKLLSVPLALENISTLFEWPESQMDEAEFVTEVLERTDTLLLLDIANVYANARNLGGDPVALLDRLPLHRLAYVHMGGGIDRDGVYHDTHAAAIPAGAIALLEELCAKVEPPGVMLERDDNFPSDAELQMELESIAAAISRGRERRKTAHEPIPSSIRPGRAASSGSGACELGSARSGV
jgi:uncharacterized protein